MEIIKNENDFYTNIEHAMSAIDKRFTQYPGFVVCGSHNPKDVDRKLATIKYAREKDIPCLGVCMGMQLMIIEYARNILGLKDANSTEIDPLTPDPVIIKLPKLRVGIHQVDSNWESHWHHYAFNNKYRELFAKDWRLIYGEDDILEGMRLQGKKYHFGVQFHPEYQENHPLLGSFIKSCQSNVASVKV